jgi:hypothetical protein
MVVEDEVDVVEESKGVCAFASCCLNGSRGRYDKRGRVLWGSR